MRRLSRDLVPDSLTFWFWGTRFYCLTVLFVRKQGYLFLSTGRLHSCPIKVDVLHLHNEMQDVPLTHNPLYVYIQVLVLLML